MCFRLKNSGTMDPGGFGRLQQSLGLFLPCLALLYKLGELDLVVVQSIKRMS
jgi:hypothetical protein